MERHVYSIQDVCKLLGKENKPLCYCMGSRLILKMKKEVGDSLEMRGYIHVEDYNEYFRRQRQKRNRNNLEDVSGF